MDAAQRGPIAYRVLGTVAAERDGTPIALGGPRQRALLALLLLTPGRPVTVDRLIDELWAGEPTDGADTTLRSYVSRLRTALGAGGALRASLDGYALEVEPGRIDSRRFEALIRQADDAQARRRTRDARANLSAALALWAGRPYGELGADGSLRDEAERLAELRVHAVERLFEIELELGRTGELVDELEAAVREHPFRESLWRSLMLALYRAGRQADALGAYHRARAELEDQLGITPGEGLERLQLQILQQEVPSAGAAAVRENLPNPLTSFIGRAADLERVVDAVGRQRLVTLTGVGGVGKTRLAIEAARRLLDQPDGVWFIDLAPLADQELLPGYLGAILEVHEQSGIEPIDRLVTAVAGRELLLLLDNCEHLREAAAAVASRLLAAAPGIRILATSRELLGIPGETEVAVQPLTLPTAASAESARDSEAVALLLARATSARPDLRTEGDALLVAAQIVRDLDGLPLAIELAAARARALSLGDIAERLDDRFRFLVSWRRLAPARHRTLREAMDWSFELLSEPERRLLARLAVFAGSFDLRAVNEICSDGGEDVALRALERLVDASLVAATETPAGVRYRLLETVRQYAVTRLVEAGELDGARLAHAAYFTSLAESVPSQGSDQARGFALIDLELDNLRAAFETVAATGDVELELRLAAAVWRFWQVRGHLAEGTNRLEHALARPGAPGAQAYARALYGAGIFDWAQGRYDRGEAVGRDLLEHAARSDDPVAAYSGSKLLSMVALRRRDFDASDEHARNAIAISHQLGPDHDGLIDELNYAVLLLDRGRMSEAVPRLQEVLARYKDTGNLEGIGLAHLNLGEAAALGSDLAGARSHFESARAAFESIGFRAHVGHALHGLAAVETRSGNAAAAARLLGRADTVLADVGASDDDFAPALVREAESSAKDALGEMAYRDLFEAGQRDAAAMAQPVRSGTPGPR